MNDADAFVKVFDVLDSGYRTWTFPAFGLLFVAMGLFLVLLPRILKSERLRQVYFEPRWKRICHRIFAIFFLCFSVFWTVTASLTTFQEYRRFETLVHSNQCRMVEGLVEGFVPMPASGRGWKSFVVDGIRFKYSDSIVTNAFNHTSTNGGPIQEDSFVRICYDPEGNDILRLEIRGISGNTDGPSPGPLPLPWISSLQKILRETPIEAMPYFLLILIVSLCVLGNWLGLHTMSLAYLRTSVCLKSQPVSFGRIRLDLDRTGKIALRDTVLRWDNQQQVFWLRPKGAVLLSSPYLVARLVMDGSAVVRSEIRCSSGFLCGLSVIFAGFVFLAWPSISWTAKALFTLLLPVAFFWNAMVLSTTMKPLIEGALKEMELSE